MALPDGRLHVLLGIPFDRTVLGPFFQAVLRTVTDDTDVPGLPRIKVTPMLAPGAVIHLQRGAMIAAARADASVDFLVMVDSDQLFAPLVLRRLVGWNVPAVSPVIVQRLGEPIPVCYHERGQDAAGCWRYEPQTAPLYAYLSQFNPDWWANNGDTALLPLVPEHLPQMHSIPPAIRDGLGQPLLPVDAVGAGMVCLRRDVLLSLEPDAQGRFCFPGDTRVSAPTGVVRAYRRWYDGELIEIATREGHKLAGTPNHPILTKRGWVALHLLEEGDDVISRSRGQIGSTPADDPNQVDPTISEVFDFAQLPGMTHQHSGTNGQFHGDGQDGYVDVVTIDSQLLHWCKAALTQHGRQRILTAAALRTVSLPHLGKSLVGVGSVTRPSLRHGMGFGPGASFVLRKRGQMTPHVLAVGAARNAFGLEQVVHGDRIDTETPRDAVSGLTSKIGSDDASALGLHAAMRAGFRIGPVDPGGLPPAVRLRAGAQGYALCSEDAPHRRAGERKTGRKLIERVAGQVSVDQIVSVRKYHFRGHVFNLQTVGHVYVANGIVAHNCSFDQGGEDFDLCRRIRAAGWGGQEPGVRGWGIFVDRGCLVGHLLFYSRGADDFMAWLAAKAAAEEAEQSQYPPAVPDLVERLRRERAVRGNGAGAPPAVPAAPVVTAAAHGSRPPWADIVLPAVAAGR